MTTTAQKLSRENRVFLSYASEDLAVVEKIYDGLIERLLRGLKAG